MVNVPPLLCSTPPPIDFGEDDDDSGLQSTINLDDDDDDFGLVTSSRSALTKETHTEAQPVYSERPPELELIGKPNAEEIKQTAEAFNYQVKQSPSLDDYQETPPPLDEQLQEEDDDGEEEEIANINDNVPSLKLDSLSLYSTESVSAASTLSPVAVADEEMPAPTKAPAAPPALSHQVTLEDVSDDSDEECSPKKPKELFIREGAEDFFAIEVLATPTDTAFSFPSASSLDKPAVEADSVQFVASFEAATEQSVEQQQQQEEHQESPAATEDDEFDDFGDFADFSAVPEPAVEAPVQQAAPPAPVAKDSLATAPTPAPAADDGFDDFQEFATPPEENADDDDDDFGDFSEPLTAAMPTMAAVPPPPQPAAAPLSIDERIKPVLELMFPLSQTSSAATEAKRRPLAQCQSFNFGAIEQAQALDYQWTSSEMRHSLVRALGIDSRNILFGDKWNASMPRFAANLSFDPLKPLKPLEASSQQLSSVGLEATAAAAPQTSQAEARSGASNGENCVPASSSSSGSEISSSFKQNHNPSAELNSDCLESTAAASAAAAAAATATLSTALSANGYGHNLNGSEQLHQQQQHQQQPAHQQQFDLRAPTPPPVAAPTPAEDLRPTASTPTGFAMPLKETHIYTPSKSDTAVARTTTLAPIDFDYEIAATGIIIDETVVKKEYRDVEYKPPPFGLDSPSRLASSNGASSFELPTTTPAVAEDDDFSDFQSMPAKTQAALQPPRNGTPTFGEQMILCPAILLPQAIPLAKTAIEWGDNALSSINAEEMARIEDLFSAQSKPPTISATVAKQPPQQQQQQQEDDEWSDFVSVPVGQQQQQPQQQTFSNNNNVNSLKKPPTGPSSTPKDDDWSDFVSSTPLPARPSAPQFNSGAWQSANFYNNPLSLYQHQKQTHAHSNLVPSSGSSKSKSNTNTNHNNNNNNNNNVPATPQQIHIMHDFSTAPSTAAGGAGVGATYQQHHQRQQFQIGNAKVAPRISLIPDLSFVAPALPTNAGAFMGSLPKPSFGGKK